MKFKNIIYLVSATFFMLTSCTSGFLDINDNPNRPTTAELSKLLSGAQWDMAQAYSAGNFIGASLPSTTWHLTSRETDNYGISPTTSTMGNTWLQAYAYALKNTNAVVRNGVASENFRYAGIGKLMMAYTFLNIVDLWGDVPYTEFDIESNYAPVIDSSKDIYNSLLDLIDEAIADLNNENPGLLLPSNDDIIYGGNAAMWIRMGNTLKLKILLQSRKASSDITGWNEKLTSLLNQNEFINSRQDFEFMHTGQDNPDERHPAYVAEYLGGQSTYYISPWFYETMTGQVLNVTDNPFENIQDPRVPYYWVNQLTADGVAQNQTDYRDGAFVSIFFASNATYAGNDQRNTSTFLGIYPCGGKYDDGRGGRLNQSVGNGIAPEKMLMAYSVPFMKAELYLTGVATGDARAMLEQGIRESIIHVNAVTAASDPTAPSISADATTDFVNRILQTYDAASTNEAKLRIVMTQKWIANFFNTVEAYTDMRRTGYPVVLDRSTQFAQSPMRPDREPTLGPVQIPLNGINAFPRVMWYPTSEITRNPNVSNSDRNVTTSVLFWDK